MKGEFLRGAMSDPLARGLVFPVPMYKWQNHGDEPVAALTLTRLQRFPRTRYSALVIAKTLDHLSQFLTCPRLSLDWVKRGMHTFKLFLLSLSKATLSEPSRRIVRTRMNGKRT
jgi:hypothetical protein